MTFFEELQWRGLVKDITSPDLIEKLNKGGVTFYIGCDPTADSLHLGHYLSAIATVKRLKDAGHNPIIIAGGGTGLIGDPKPNVERPMISKEAVEHNIECITKQLNNLFDVKVVNNAEWLLKMNAIDYLRDYGKYFNVNYMINKDTVKSRLETGISYTEFSYMILQSIDFLKLYENYNVTMQVGGQDQWGNITSGLELIRKVHGIETECYGFTIPLLLRKDGTKFGKSEKGECYWLDKEKTSPYEMYQFLVNQDDSLVIDYLKKLTFLSKEQIDKIEEEHKISPENRLAGKTLAYEVVKFLHGEEEANKAKTMSEEIFNKKGNIDNMPSITILKNNKNILDILVASNLASSKSEARRLVEQGGISLNQEKITDPNYEVKDLEFVIQKGKKIYLKIILN